MRRLVVLATMSMLALLPACRVLLQDTSTGADDTPGVDAYVSPACAEAKTHSDLAWIETNVFKSCTFMACHHGQAGVDAGRLDLRSGMSYPFLVDFTSNLDPTRKLVVPSKPNQSYLLYILKQIPAAMMDPPTSPPPATIGFMPQNAGGTPICAEKRDAIQRWIEAGAPM